MAAVGHADAGEGSPDVATARLVTDCSSQASKKWQRPDLVAAISYTIYFSMSRIMAVCLA